MKFQLIFLPLLIIHLVGLTKAQNAFLGTYCYPDGNNTENSLYYKANLDNLLSSMSPNIRSNGFYSASEGNKSDQANAIALCRGDVHLDTCRSCVTNATQKLLQDCPSQKSAIAWYDFCMVRYSNSSILGTVNTEPNIQLKNTRNVSNVDQFYSILQSSLDDLRGKAASEGDLRKFATGKTWVTKFEYLYGLVQCTPDLSKDQCSNCLINLAQKIINFVNGAQGGRILGASCNFHYEIYPFFNQTMPINEYQP